jgi:hypothetical protein
VPLHQRHHVAHASVERRHALSVYQRRCHQCLHVQANACS